MMSEVKQAPGGYVPPGNERLCTTLLDETKKRCDRVIAPLYAEHATTGCKLCCDESSNVNYTSVINVLLVSPSGALSYKASECSKETTTAEWISHQTESGIQSVGEKNIVQVRTLFYLVSYCEVRMGTMLMKSLYVNTVFSCRL